MGALAIVPQIVLALLLVVLGVIIGSGIGRLLERGMNRLPVAHAFESAGIAQLIARSGHTLDAGALLGRLIEWFIVLVFIVAALDVLKLDQVNVFLRDVALSYLPHVIVAVLILLAAALLADFVHKTVAGTARAASVSSPHMLGMVARTAIWAFAILAALHELRVAPAFTEILFTGVVVAFSIALGLSFGLGGRDAAARYLEKLAAEMSEGRRQDNDS